MTELERINLKLNNLLALQTIPVGYIYCAHCFHQILAADIDSHIIGCAS